MGFLNYLAITLPGGQSINAPSKVPVGGIRALAAALKVGVTILLVFATIYTLIMLLWGSVLWITSAGDKGRIEKARSRIMFALIGLAFAFGSFAIMALLSKLFNIPLLEITVR